MREEKMCPSRSAGVGSFDCNEELCAWWDSIDKQCSTVTLADSLSDVYMFIRLALKPRDWSDDWGEDSEDEED